MLEWVLPKAGHQIRHQYCLLFVGMPRILSLLKQHGRSLSFESPDAVLYASQSIHRTPLNHLAKLIRTGEIKVSHPIRLSEF